MGTRRSYSEEPQRRGEKTQRGLLNTTNVRLFFLSLQTKEVQPEKIRARAHRT